MKQLHLSYSLINAWRAGQRGQQLWDLYTHSGQGFMNDGMVLGRDFDNYAKEYVLANNKLPPILGGKQLVNGIPAFKLKVPYNDKFVLSGEFDTLDPKDIYEYKCSGAQDSSDYLNDWQVSFYMLMCKLRELPVRAAYVYRVDPNKYQYFKRTGDVMPNSYDVSYAWYSKRRVQDAVDKIELYKDEMYDYFVAEGII